MEAREKQAQILREATNTRDAIVGQAQEKAHEESARILSETKTEIESQKQAAIRDIRSQVAELSVQIAEKILQKELSSSAEQTQLIDRLLDEVASSNGTESK
jgi:ATP synthase subunit b